MGWVYAVPASSQEHLPAAPQLTDADVLAGAVDFALVFSANYRRPKKRPSPHARAVYLLQTVLGKVC